MLLFNYHYMELSKKDYITPEIEVLTFEGSSNILDMSPGGEIE